MVPRDSDAAKTISFAERCENFGLKLSFLIRSHNIRDAKRENHCDTNFSATVCAEILTRWYTSGQRVYLSIIFKIWATIERRQRADQVDVNVAESAVRYSEWRYQRYNMSVHLSPLSNRIVSSPVTNLVVHIWPAVSLLDQSERGFDPGVCVIMQDIENTLSEHRWNVSTRPAGC